MSRKNQGVPDEVVVCLVECHYLAARYLIEKLRQCPAIRLLPSPQDLTSTPGEPNRLTVVFAIDNGTLPLALSEYLRGLRVAFPNGKYVVLDQEASEDEMLRLLLLGVHGFVRYDRVSDSLISAIQRVFRGGTWVSEEVLQKYIDYSSKLITAKRSPAGNLTRRENQVLELVRRRLSNKEIADVLRVSEATVKFHLSHIFSKLQVHDRHSLCEQANGSSSIRGALHLKPSTS